jgi:Secretion system C-terminal sorting domain
MLVLLLIFHYRKTRSIHTFTIKNTCSMKWLPNTANTYRVSILLLLCCLHTLLLHAQTNISGVVNSYYRVVEIIPAKACIRVTSTAGLTANKRILLLQMKGASVSTTNNAGFGDTLSTNEAGYYEAGTICAINGDSVFLFHNLLHTYNPATGKVQLVLFAEYISANVVDTVKAGTWNNTTGTGGVIALFADLSIELNAPVFAGAAGYSGGQFVLSNGTCSNALPATGYAYNGSNTSPQNGASKGEGIADIGSTQTGGRGAPANGGGGGNNHNNSGGGGANLNTGGNGGGNSSTSGCTVTLKGLGGKALKNWSGEKIYMGGGGGAGHSNNGLITEGGGNGGGIIFIWTNSITGNNQLISANGKAGGNSLSDGAGGGGAGGTIILAVNNYSGLLTIEAKGGKGGDSDDGGNIGRCFGGGGGGSGGAVYFTGAIPPVTTTVTGGTAGIETGRDASCAAAQPAAAGADGQVFSSYTFSRSAAPAGYCSLLLPSKLVSFSGQLFEQGALLKWTILNPELVQLFTVEKKEATDQWRPLFSKPAENGREDYNGIDHTVLKGENYYRLRIAERNGNVYYSPVIHINRPAGAGIFSFYPNPASRTLTIYRNSSTAARIKLSDINGKKILEKTSNQTREEIMLPPLPSGIYLLQVNEAVQKLLIR